MKWLTVRLEDIAIDMQPGFAMQPNRGEVGIPHLRTNNVSEDGRLDLSSIKMVMPSKDQIEKYSLAPGDILFNNTNSPALVGKTAFFNDGGQFLFSNHMTRIRMSEKVADPRFIARYLHWNWKTGGFRAMVTQWVNQAAINRSQLARLHLSLPPLSEQRRIVEILDQADALRKKRAEANVKAGRILDALFIKMFGDPATNPKGWAISTLSDITKVIHRYPTFYGQEYVESGVPVVRIGDILPNHILSREIDQYAKVPESFSDKFPLTLLEANDIVMAVRGDTTGKIGLVPDELKGSNISPNLIRISPNQTVVNPYYFYPYMLLANQIFNTYITNTAKKSITAKNLKSIPIFVPPMELQERFELMVSRILLMDEHRLTSYNKIEELFSTLLYRAFSGDLTGRWREGHMKELLAEMREQTKYLAPHGAHNQRENAVQQESLF